MADTEDCTYVLTRHLHASTISFYFITIMPVSFVFHFLLLLLSRLPLFAFRCSYRHPLIVEESPPTLLRIRFLFSVSFPSPHHTNPHHLTLRVTIIAPLFILPFSLLFSHSPLFSLPFFTLHSFTLSLPSPHSPLFSLPKRPNTPGD